MKVLKINNHEDYISISKDVEVKVNDFITVKSNVQGILNKINSKKFGKLLTIEDSDFDFVYYLGEKKTNQYGFKELYEKLYTENFRDFERDIENFIYEEVSKSYKKSLYNLSRNEKLELLNELLDSAKTFVYESGEVIKYIYDINKVLLSLGEPRLKTQKFEGDEVKYGLYGVYKNDVKQIINKLCDTQKD